MIGQITLWHSTTAPADHWVCNGDLKGITWSPQLYALYGTQYGGDGRTTFKVPDLSSTAPSGFVWIVKFQ